MFDCVKKFLPDSFMDVEGSAGPGPSGLRPSPSPARRYDNVPRGNQQIVDLQTMVEKWAWNSFHWKKTRAQKKLKTEFIRLTIDWKNVVFDFEEPIYEERKITNAIDKTKNAHPKVIFRTIFTNDTGKIQLYSFKTERTTSSTATVAVEEGFTAGAEFQLGLKTPCEVVEGSAGFKSEIQVASAKEDTVEEQLTWGVDSQVTVEPGHKTTAELVVTEQQVAYDFQMQIRISGRIVAVFSNMNDNNKLVRVCEGFILEIIRHEIESEGLRGFRIQDGVVISEVKGQCTFKFGVEQHVAIREEKFNPSYF